MKRMAPPCRMLLDRPDRAGTEVPRTPVRACRPQEKVRVVELTVAMLPCWQAEQKWRPLQVMKRKRDGPGRDSNLPEPADWDEGTEAGSYLRLIDSGITQLKAQGPSRTCNESEEDEKKKTGTKPSAGPTHPHGETNSTKTL